MTTEFDSHSLDDVADSVSAHRLSSVQLQLGSAVRSIPTATALLEGLDALGEAITENLARRCRTVFDARGIEIAAVDGTYNMVHLDRRRRQRNLGHLIRLINLAPTFGTRIVTLCTGSRDDIMWRAHPDNQSTAAWRDLLIELEAAVPAAEAAGVLLAFEPEHNNVVNSAQRARQLIDDLGSPALKVLMDAANIFGTGDLERMRDHLREAFDLVGADIALAHAKDLDHDGDAGGRAAGQGYLDYQLYLSLLRDHGFDGAVILHQLTELAPDGLDTAFTYVRDLAPTGYLD
ncbi:MAG TPA: sugar phosphate isomerase/epimerase [Microlunatus sp.]|nr:sugar phosphate isomerase/epimerase [Microlunatus sp.]